MRPTFLWVSKFDVKLGSGDHEFWNYNTHVSFEIFGSKSLFFKFVRFFWKSHKRFFPFRIEKSLVPNFSPFFVYNKWIIFFQEREAPNVYGWMDFFRLPPTLSLRGTVVRTDGTDGNQKCPSMFFILCAHLENLYIYT